MTTTYCELCGAEFTPEGRDCYCHQCQRDIYEPQEEEDMSDIKLIDIY